MGGIEHDSRNVGDQSVDIRVVSFSGNTLACVRRRHDPHIGGVGLLCADDAVRSNTKKTGDTPKVFIYVFVRVIETAPEIKAGKPSLRDTALPCGKTVADARKLLPCRKGQERKEVPPASGTCTR